MSDREEAARLLAQIHYRSLSTTHVYLARAAVGVEEPPDAPIKLLEVNEDTFPSGIVQLRFGAIPDSGIDYPCLLIEVTPEEFELIEAGELELPEGWEQYDLIEPWPETTGPDG